MRRILIDLTDLEKWAGHHGGTQRVVYGIAKNYYLGQRNHKDEKVCFIAFSETDKKFYLTDFSPIYERVEAIAKSTVATSSEPLSKKAKIKHAISLYTPELVKENEQIRTGAKRALRVAGKAYRKVRAVRAPAIKPGSAKRFISFSSNDVVLILGKPWDNLDIQKTLVRAKEQSGFKLIQVVYDLILPLHPHLHHPSLFAPYTKNLFEAVASSDLLLPISESTDRDLKIFCDRLNLPHPKTAVIRLGDEVARTHNHNIEPPVDINGEFIACIGTIEIRKNHNLLYYAYKLAAEKGIELPTLLIVGSKGWLTHDIQYLINNDPHVKNKIKILTNINDIGLDWIYKNCLFTVYPSMYEGWGLPIAESLAYGKLCISSNTSSMTEIAGDLIEYFSPFNTEECLSKIVTYSSKTKLNQKENVIARRYKATQWTDTYREVVNAINSI